MSSNKYFFVVQLLFSFCFCEISNNQKEKLLNGFKEYYNNLPNQVYRSEEGSLLNAQHVIQSGEQFIGIPRDQPSAPCVGCASHVNPQAAGVSDLANLGVRHLDLHEPSVKHSLESVIDVERQVQVVNGVRYVLTLSINSNHCTEVESENCASSKTCKITILVKPWVKLSNGGNYRAILANNCTEEWQYGDNGEVLPELSADNNRIMGNNFLIPGDSIAFDGDKQVKYNINTESQPNQERVLTDEDICESEKDLYRTKRRASSSRVRRQLTLGGVKEHDPANSVFKALAEESLRKYVVESGITQPVQVARIEKVTTQVVSGTLTRIDFLVSSSLNSETIKCHSKVWDRPWLNSKEINVSCQNDGHRGKRQVPGGISEVDPTEPRYKALAEESLRKYMIDFAIAQPLEVVHVAKVTTQDVAGSLTRIDFLVSGNADSKTIKCYSEVWELGWLNRKEIEVSCQNYGDLRGKRQVPGGISEVDPTEPRYKALAEESLRKYIIDFAIAQPLEVVHVEKVTTQVVAGSLTRIDFLVSGSPDSKTIKCHSEVWEQVWRNFKEIKVSCENDGHRGKRQVPGGISEVDPTEPRYKALAEESLRKYIIDFAIAQPLEVVHVEKVTTQVVAGSLTRIDFLVSGSPDSKTIKCHSEVWEQVWRNFKEIKVSCENDGHRGKRQVPGGISEADPTEPRYKALAEESLRKYMIDFAIAQPLEVVHVEKVTTQVVAGSLTRIDFLVSGSPDSKTIKCHSEVWEQVWRNFKEIKVSCENDGHRGKRQVSGGISEVDPTEPQYKALAEESLRKYMIDFAIAQPLEVVHVVKVTTQVVAGSLTRIDFLVSGSPHSKLLKCHSKVFDRPWLNRKNEIDVSCQNYSHLRGKRQLVGGLGRGLTKL